MLQTCTFNGLMRRPQSTANSFSASFRPMSERRKRKMFAD